MTVGYLLGLDDFGSLVDLAVHRILVSDEVVTTKFRLGAPGGGSTPRAAGAGRGRSTHRADGAGLGASDPLLEEPDLRQHDCAEGTARPMADPEQAPSTAPTSSRSVSGSTSSPSSCSGSCGARRPPTHRLASLCRCIQGVRIHWPPCTISTHGRALDLATKWACSADLSREGLPSRREERPVMSRSTSTVRLTCVALGRRANGWPIGHHEELSKLLDTAQVVNVCRWAS